MRLSLVRLALVLAISGVVVAQQAALPLDPIAAILEAFRTHDIVALSEGRHNNEQGYAFRMALVRDPRFPGVVNDIVVESGTARYQEVMDRFVADESVPDAVLRRAWQDTTQPDAVWDSPMYEEFFRAVRAVNASLPPARRLRVLLGDPPFDWDTATRESWLRIDRDRFAADVVQREVLAKQRRALVIYGNAHLMRQARTLLVARLMQAPSPPRIFNIWTHTSGSELSALQPDIEKWPVPSLAMTKGTALGDASFNFYGPGGGESSVRMVDQFDAVLYVGRVASVTIRRDQIAPSLCADAEYMKMRLGRMALIDPPGAQLPPGVVSPAERLKRYCSAVASK